MKFHLLGLLQTTTIVGTSFAFAGIRTSTTRSSARPVNQRPASRLWSAPTDDIGLSSRRDWLVAASVASLGVTIGAKSLPAYADGQETASSSTEMKEFVDPKGLFSIRIPKRYFALRRSAKGDLPDPKTGQGRRGSSIFTAGDMQKAELVAIERFPTRVLLEENGIEATGDLSTFPRLGKPDALANLLNLRRERDKPGQSNTVIVPNSVSVSSDGKELTFKLRTEIEVQKPELLMQEYGVSELFRITVAKASLGSNDGNLLAVFASALESDFNGPDGAELQEAVQSFQVTDLSTTAEASS